MQGKEREMKKTMKKLLPLLLAVVMCLAFAGAALAEGETPQGGLTLDDSISVTGLQDGDTVSFYKVLQWDNGWKLADGFTLTDDELAAVVGTATTPGAISSTVAGKLGTQAANATVKYGSLPADSGQVAQSNPEAGLYIAIITPKAGSSGYTYNPVFVAADYYQPDSGNTNTWDVTTAMSYSDNAMAKKSEVTLEKTAKDATTVDDNDEETVAVGDTVTFTVTTVIPGFSDNYTAPVFKVTDTLSAGLELVTDSEKLDAPTGANVDYDVTENGTSGFTLAFSADYLKTVKTATAVTITYQAKVTSAAATSVNQETNTVTVNYSNSPSDTEGHGVLKDKTNHYTFDINGDLFGGTNYETTEVVKVGVDKDGNEITKTVQVDNGNSYGALQGAEFKLYKDEACKQEYSNTLFTNPITTDAKGKLKIKGLDAGTYYLKETKAPDGYIADTAVHTIEIKTTITEKEVTEKVDGVDVTYKTNSLDSYSIKIDGIETANYTMTNNLTQDITSVTQGDTVVGTDDHSGKIKNTQGVELPSTGGIGTTIFYIAGSALVLVAGAALFARRVARKQS